MFIETKNLEENIKILGVNMNNTHEIFDSKFTDYIMRTINVDNSDFYNLFLK